MHVQTVNSFWSVYLDIHQPTRFKLFCMNFKFVELSLTLHWN
jgi:hypothetical protein